MLSNFLNLFRKDPEKVAEEWYNSKTELMEAFLGQEHNMVMHAIIPYEVGGTLDLYYYPNDINGVGIATKELSRTPKKGSSNKIFKVYELVMFTKHDLDLDSDENSDFGKMHSNISSALNVIARYSGSASLNPHETCEFPAEMEELGGKCFIFDGYKSDGSKSLFGIMLVIEVFRDEMEFARNNGCSLLIEKLKEAGHYPYSDLDRDPVV